MRRLLLAVMVMDSFLGCAATESTPKPTAQHLYLGALRVDHRVDDSSRKEDSQTILLELSEHGTIIKKIQVRPNQQYALRLPFGNYSYTLSSVSTKSRRFESTGRFTLGLEYPTETLEVSALLPARELYLLRGGAISEKLLVHAMSSLTLLTSKHNESVLIRSISSQRYRDPEHPDSNGSSASQLATANSGGLSSTFRTVRAALSDNASNANSMPDGKFDKQALATLDSDFPHHGPLESVKMNPQGTSISIPATIYLPAGKWSVSRGKQVENLELGSGDWTVVDYDVGSSPVPNVKVFKQ